MFEKPSADTRALTVSAVVRSDDIADWKLRQASGSEVTLMSCVKVQTED